MPEYSKMDDVSMDACWILIFLEKSDYFNYFKKNWFSDTEILHGYGMT